MEDIVRDTRPDVAHLHNVAHQLTPSIVHALGRARVPVVQTLHDYKIACPAYLFLSGGAVCERCKGGRFHEVLRRRCHKGSRAASAVVMAEAYVHRALRSYDRVGVYLCPSLFMRDTMARHGLPPRKLTHLPYFVPAAQYAPARAAGDGVVYIGRLSHEKGLRTLLSAMRRLPDHTLTILGEGPLRDQVDAAARAGQRVVARGYLQGDDLHDAVRAARVVVVPSEWYENLPYAILESFALARAVVGARIGGIPELVRDDVTGATFTPGDDADCARALAPYLAEPARAIEHGRAARALIEREFAPAPHLERLMDAYAQAAA
jgi:glycosyltransferase involved in cell wall biosynthesis